MSATMKEYRIQSVAGEPDWTTVPQLEVGNILWLPDVGIRAFGQFCHDAEYLYVHLRAVEQDIRAEHVAPLSMVCEDSCLEFFFMPEGEDRYFNFEINPNGCLHIGLGRNRNERERIVPDNPKELFSIRTLRTAEGWETQYRIPAAFLRKYYPEFVFSGILKANVYKCGDKTVHPHYLAWKPVGTAEPDYHRPEYFGEMIFG